MKNRPAVIFHSPLEEDVYEGLQTFPKKLSSNFFYDEKGDRLFQQIMQLPEYYLTRCEYEIFLKEKSAICHLFDPLKTGFDLIELGAGDGQKTKVLLKTLVDEGYNFRYKPIDISQNALDGLKAAIESEIPEVTIEPEQGTYFDILKKLATYSNRKKVIMVLGSNMGNLPHYMALRFMQNIKSAMNPQDILLLGLDLKKDPQVILNAYNDATGVTAAFNKNILQRINTEMNADFNTDNFTHWETYDPETGTAKSYLVAKQAHQVTINTLGITVNFAAWETIHTEISQKYDHDAVKWLAEQAGLTIHSHFTDSKNYFADYLFTITP